MNFKKTIRIFLLDGEINGRLTCELSNWTGKAYKIPRNKIIASSDRSELLKAGVYMLFGKSEDDSYEGEAYIGESENIFERLKQHLKEKEFWYDSMAIISKDENLNKAHIKYLENKIFSIAENTKRFKIHNENIPAKPSISESESAEMDEFLSNIKILVNTLGYKIFDETASVSKEKKKSEIFYISATRGAKASGKSVSDGFLVFKNSEIAFSLTNSYPESMKRLRDKLMNENIIKKTNEKFLLSKDYIFSSPSTAATIVMGRSANGKTEWKLENGKTLQEVEEFSEE
ncbi:MAG TPA: GIY-YIG nuclease family protein [Leptospiraceae bacterium]|nr:GIY-YIG nuclease family protein [Leptospiraceae bacterium]HMX31812.1 GIY-YIG nuclease family protein [Leptospiraceae bacterium]HMY32545.1 GIY-YIG nuclease family protein [Leptospiraceae bacterium]HNA06876.1 GIY-YIG nuclease family protein [Leptospiraceae bacterium]HNB99291.1 GIY-YIG nuclease family protein [Leptospiraceae bacterium]